MRRQQQISQNTNLLKGERSNDEGEMSGLKKRRYRQPELNKSENKPSATTSKAAELFARLAKLEPVGKCHSTVGDSEPEEQLQSEERSITPSDDRVTNISPVNYDNFYINTQDEEPIMLQILNRMTIIEDTIQAMGKQQERCVLLLAQANAKLDSLAPDQNQIALRCGKQQEFILTPVKCLKELEEYEERSKDVIFVENVLRSMEQIHGKNRFKTKGVTVCLQLIDYFVDRKFFRQCSWTGISKSFDGNKNLLPKIAFSKYEKYINLFYEVIRNADEDFTRIECEKFLKQCLRNSKQRLDDSKMQRLPAARNRRKVAAVVSDFDVEYLEETSANIGGGDQLLDNELITEIAEPLSPQTVATYLISETKPI